MKARIFITLKSEVHDPQERVVKESLAFLGFSGVRSIRQGRMIDIETEHKDWKEAEKELRLMCELHLVNEVTEDYAIEKIGEEGEGNDEEIRPA